MAVTDTEVEALLWQQSALQDEVRALRALLRKVQRSPGNWAALSYVDGVHGHRSHRWSAEEQDLLRRAGLGGGLDTLAG